MEMVSEGPGHEFDGRPCQRPTNIFGIPAHIYSDLAHRKICRESIGVRIDDRFEAQAPANFGCAANPIVTLFHVWVEAVAHIEVSAPPETVCFRFHCFVDETASDGGVRTIYTRDKQ